MRVIRHEPTKLGLEPYPDKVPSLGDTITHEHVKHNPFFDPLQESTCNWLILLWQRIMTQWVVVETYLKLNLSYYDYDFVFSRLRSIQIPGHSVTLFLRIYVLRYVLGCLARLDLSRNKCSACPHPNLTLVLRQENTETFPRALCIACASMMNASRVHCLWTACTLNPQLRGFNSPSDAILAPRNTTVIHDRLKDFSHFNQFHGFSPWTLKPSKITPYFAQRTYNFSHAIHSYNFV